MARCVRCGRPRAGHPEIPLEQRLRSDSCPSYVQPAPIRSAAAKLLGALTRRSG